MASWLCVQIYNNSLQWIFICLWEKVYLRPSLGYGVSQNHGSKITLPKLCVTRYFYLVAGGQIEFLLVHRSGVLVVHHAEFAFSLVYILAWCTSAAITSFDLVFLLGWQKSLLRAVCFVVHFLYTTPNHCVFSIMKICQHTIVILLNY